LLDTEIGFEIAERTVVEVMDQTILQAPVITRARAALRIRRHDRRRAGSAGRAALP